MKVGSTKRIVLASLFASLICVTTAFIQVPMPLVGYINLGDALVLCSGAMLGPLGAVSALVGSVLADILIGFALYAPATAVIKSAMALIVWLFLNKSNEKFMPKFIASGVVAELVMVAGYFLYECLLYGKQTAIASVLYNLLQGALSLVCGVIIVLVLRKTGLMEKK